jgi:hypothetical protein
VFGESAELYDTLFTRVAAEAKPENAIEWLLIKDVADLTWEIERLRDVQVSVIRKSMAETLTGYLLPSTIRDYRGDLVYGADDIAEEPRFTYVSLAHRYFAGDRAAQREVAAILAEKGIDLDMDSLKAAAFSKLISTLEVMSRMTASAESRRERILREFDRRRRELDRPMDRAMGTENYSSKAGKEIEGNAKIIPENGTKVPRYRL